MSHVELSQEKIVEIMIDRKPKSISELFRCLGGEGKLNGSTANKMRELVYNLDGRLAENKALATSKDEEGAGSTEQADNETDEADEAEQGDNETADNETIQPQKPNEPVKSSKTKPPKTTHKVPVKKIYETRIPRHSQNPFRLGSGYGLLVDIIANAGDKGISKYDLTKTFCEITGKDETHARYDLAVINSASETSERRHRSCRDGFVVIRDVENYKIRFD